MEYRYNSDFFPRLEFCCYEKYLKEYCRNEEKIISIHDSLKWIPVFRNENHENEKEPKNTSIGLSVDKYEEVMEIRIHILYSVLFDKKKYHFSEGLYRYPHEKEPENSYDKMSPSFSEFFDHLSTEHHDYSSDDTCHEYCNHTVYIPISMHCNDICHTRSGEGKGECERYNESFIEIFMDKMISFDFIDFCTIRFLSLYHREGYKKKDDRSSNSKILSFESEKCKHILSQEKCSKHCYKQNKSQSCPIFPILFRCSVWMKFCIKRKRCERLKEGNK